MPIFYFCVCQNILFLPLTWTYFLHLYLTKFDLFLSSNKIHLSQFKIANSVFFSDKYCFFHNFLCRKFLFFTCVFLGFYLFGERALLGCLFQSPLHSWGVLSWWLRGWDLEFFSPAPRAHEGMGAEGPCAGRGGEMCSLWVEIGVMSPQGTPDQDSPAVMKRTCS